MRHIARRLAPAAAGLTLVAAVAASASAQAQVQAQAQSAAQRQPQAQAQPPGKPGAKGRPATPGAAPKKGPSETRFTLVLNGLFAPGGPSYDHVRTPIAYAEPSTITSRYETGSGFGGGVAIQAKLYRGLGALVGYSLVSRDATGTIDVSRPHPLYLNRPRTASAELTGYGYTEGAADIDAAYAGASGKLDFTVFAGVTLFQVEADLASVPTFDERYPYDTLAISATPAASADATAVGFNLGGRLDYRFSRAFGAGIQLRYATASVELPGGADGTSVTIDAGGFSVGAGVRFYF